MKNKRHCPPPLKPPGRCDYNLCVIGAGAAGLVAAYIGAAVRAKTALIEAHKMGGDCLNTGCVPSKALIAAAQFAHQASTAQTLGFNRATLDFEFSKIMDRVKQVIQKIDPHDSVDRYTRMGVDCYEGLARIVSPFEVRVGQTVLTTKNIIVATGASPFVPELPGLDRVDYLTSDTVWDLEDLPRRLLILGAGPVACELGQAFSRLGARVTLVQRGERILKQEDPDVSDCLADGFKSEGIQVLTGHTPKKIRTDGRDHSLVCTHDNTPVSISFDRILLALGRTPNANGFGLEELGVKLTPSRAILTDDFLRTNYPNIFCSGDVHGLYQFTHTAAHESWYAAVNALFGKFKKFKPDYTVIPRAVFTDPETARVGLNEMEAIARNIPYEKVVYPLADLDRAIADSKDNGFVKVLTTPGKDTILGVTIVGSRASDTIAEFVLAMKQNIGLNKILGTIHIYPTMAEANKYAAGMWKKAHAPKRLLSFLERYHTWMRR